MLLDISIFCDPNVCSALAVSELGDSDHDVVSVFKKFRTNLKVHISFHGFRNMAFLEFQYGFRSF